MEILFHYCLISFMLWTAAVSIDASEEFDIINEENVTCQYNLNKTTGDVSLKNNTFPGECYWIISPVNKTSTMTLFVKQLFLDDNDTVTFYDTLDDAKNNTSPLLHELHSQIGSFAIVFGKPTLVVKLKGSSTTAYKREFDIYYQSQDCSLAINSNTITLITTPIFVNITTAVECHYHYDLDMQHHYKMPTFVFEEFSFSSGSKISLEHSSQDGLFSTAPPVDFFPTSNPLKININLDPKGNSSFRLRIRQVNPACGKYIEFTDSLKQYILSSPAATLDNGTIVNECRWIFYNTKDGVMGIVFNKLEFDNVLDIVAINNGGSELSPPLAQVTVSGKNNTSFQFIRTTGKYMWVSFKPISFASNFSANVTVHGQGGYYSGNGTISMNSAHGNDAVFLLEVEKDQVVLLNFNESQLSHPSSIKIYDDFESTNLLTTLHTTVWYPILSRTSKMMIIATGFDAGSFTAEFKGISPGCMHMSSLNADNYILSGNCDATCTWIVPPQDTESNELLLHLQYLSLDVKDRLEIIRLDSNKTLLGSISSNVSHVPLLTIPANVGGLINVTRGNCSSQSDIALVGHISYLPACGAKFSVQGAQVLRITSPSYPDTYPLFSKCTWNIDAPKDNLLHIAFDKLKLAANHCLTIKQTVENKTTTYIGESLPQDELINGSIVVEFDSSNCGSPKVQQTLASDEGFEFNLTDSDCGALHKDKSGQLKVTDVKDKSLCIWKINVPETGTDKSFILFNITRDSGDKGELSVFDGASVRDALITNFTSESWSRTNNLIVIYKIKNGSAKGFTLNYESKSCNTSMQCQTIKICMHPDWKCNGKDDCGDFSDETYCAPVPITPEDKLKGFSSTAYGLSVVFFFILGLAVAILGPYGYRRFCRGQYSRFGEISTIDN